MVRRADTNKAKGRFSRKHNRRQRLINERGTTGPYSQMETQLALKSQKKKINK